MQQTGPITEALRRADIMLGRDPRLAALQAEAVLEAVPDHPRALLIQGAARARLGDLDGAWAILAPLAQAQPRAAQAQLEFGLLLARKGRTDQAIITLQQAVALQPDLAVAWRALADLLFLAGRTAEADAAHGRTIRLSVNDPALMQAADALNTGDLPQAEALLRAHLKRTPNDVAALRMLAEVGTRLGRYPAAQALLERCLQLAPSFAGARHNLAVVLYRQNRAIDAVPHMERLAGEQPDNPNYANLLAAALASTGEYDRAIAIYRKLVQAYPEQPKLWLGLGHAARTAGLRTEAIAAYRTVLALAPTVGETWWSLANLKTGVLGADDIARMRALLAAPEHASDPVPAQPAGEAATEDRFHLHYALGRALEEQADHEAAFAHYQAGARLRRAVVSYDPDIAAGQIDRAIALLTPAFFAARQGRGCPDPAPIFIVGLPRSGSTLIEQMLASHPEVEGIMELPEMATIARELSAPGTYPDCLADIAPDAWAGWGARYLDRVRPYRRTNRPFFIDKMPNNWVHAGLIRLMLPNAIIIDARRHPMATCFSAYKQHFARGQHFSYDLTELGRYYADYRRMMAHLDEVQPGRIHRVHYEAMVQDTEAELRRLLDHCRLAFDPACLRFHENARAVRTASSEQVRQPIFREGLEHWRNYEPWLGELAAAMEV